MQAAKLWLWSLLSGYAVGQTEEETARQIQAYVPGVMMTSAGARGWSAESGQMCVLCLKMLFWNRLVTPNVQRRSGISERGSGVRDNERVSRMPQYVFCEPRCGQPHAGIFGGNDWIEAPGVGQVSHWKWVWIKGPQTRYF